MSYPVFYPVEGDILPILFDTFAGSTGASITLTGLAVTDIEIYKDTSMTQRASDSGYVLIDTDGIDLDGITGVHGFSIDLSDNTDSGFYEVGPWYYVVVSAVTVDSQTVNFIAAAFSIVSATRGLAGTALPDAAADAAGGLPISDTGGLAMDNIGALPSIALNAASIGGLVLVTGLVGLTGNDTTHIHLDGLTYGDDEINSYLLVIFDDTAGESHSRWIEDWVLSTELATVATLPFTPEGGQDTYHLLSIRADVTGGSGLDAAGVRAALGMASANMDTQLGTIDSNVDAILADTADIQPKLGAISDLGSGATIGANLADIESQTDDIGAAGAGLTAVPWNADWDAQVESEVTDALNAYDPPTRAELTADISSVLAVLQGLILENGTIGSTGNDTTHIHLDGLTYGDDEINNYLLVIFDNSASEYHARWIEDWVDSGDLATVATLPFTPESAVDSYWLLPIRQDVSGGSGLDAAGVRAAIGMASANMDTQLGTIDSNVDAALADTNELQTDWANGGRLDLIIDAILADTDELQVDDIPGLIAALNDLSAAEMRTALGLASANLDTQLGNLPTAVENADATLSRGVDNVEDTANNTSLAAVILAVLESAVSGSTWTIRKTTGATFVTKTVTTDANADPVTGVT